MQDDDHYYVEGYSAELDPYAQENGVLKNNFGITDSASLNEVEADIAGVQIQKILNEPAPKSFTALHLCALHRVGSYKKAADGLMVGVCVQGLSLQANRAPSPNKASCATSRTKAAGP